MFLLTQGFCFLDITNYLGPRTSYEKWTKAYECTAEKSWFPYEWFDTPEKLYHPGLPDYPAWYSHLKGGYVFTRDEWDGCQRLFKEKGMRTFANQDLKIHNNLTNYIILESKYFLYRCKLNKTPLSILHLTEKIKNTYYIERSIARENNKIGFHYEKWEPLLPLISP